MGHVQIATIRKLITWAQVNNLAFRHYNPDWNVLLTLAVYSYSPIEWMSIDRCQTRASAGRHYLAVLRAHFPPLWRHVFLKFSADILFDHGLNSVLLAEPYSLENWTSALRTTGIPMFDLSLGACGLILYTPCDRPCCDQLDILTNPDRVTLTKKGNSLGKNPLQISLLTYNSLKIKFVLFLTLDEKTDLPL